MTDAFDRGDGVWHPAPFRRPQRERPFLIISGPSHPFHGTEYVVVGLTRTRREAAIELDPSARAVGSPGGDSFASPWYFFTIKHEDIKRPKGALTEATTRTAANEVTAIVDASG